MLLFGLMVLCTEGAVIYDRDLETSGSAASQPYLTRHNSYNLFYTGDCGNQSILGKDFVLNSKMNGGSQRYLISSFPPFESHPLA